MSVATGERPRGSSGKSAWSVCAPLFVVAAVLAAFWPALDAQFVDWDDDRNFVANEAFRGLSAQHLAWMATTHHMGHYQPLAWLTLAVDHALWGMDARGYHLTNVLLHAATAVALYFLCLRLIAIRTRDGIGTRQRIGALVAALLFALHPLRVESVAWVTERRDVLSGLFCVLSTAAYVGYARAAVPGRGRAYALALLAFAAALLSKATSIVLPAFFLVLDLWPLGRSGWRRLLAEKLPFLALSALFAVIALRAPLATREAYSTLADHTLGERLIQAAFAPAYYVYATLWPVNLTPIHELPDALDLLTPHWALPVAATLALTIEMCVTRKRAPAACAAWICALVALAPTSGLFQAGPQLVADRYTYLAFMPLALFAGATLSSFIGAHPRWTAAGVALAGAVLLVLGVLTSRQTRVWHDSETLWTHALRVDPESPVACMNLGVVRLRQGRAGTDAHARSGALHEALELFERGHALAEDPQFLLHAGLATQLLAEVELEQRASWLEASRAAFESGFAALPAGAEVSPLLTLQYGIVLLNLDRDAQAAEVLERFVRGAPDHVHGLRMWSAALVELGRAEEALAHLEHAGELAPDDFALCRQLADTARRAGQPARARAHLQRAISVRARELGAGTEDDAVLAELRAELARLPQAP